MEDWREKFDTKLAILMGNRAEAEVIAADVAEVLQSITKRKYGSRAERRSVRQKAERR